MNDKIRKAMMRPDCIMGVVPDNGGSWLSPIREDWAQPTTLPAAAGQPWAIGSGMLTPKGSASAEDGFILPADAYYASTFDLRGYAGGLTILCDYEFFGLPAEQTGRWWIKLFEQGNMFTGGLKDYTTGVYVRKDSATSDALMYCMFCTTANILFAFTIPNFSAGRHRVALVKDTSAQYIYAYFDGAQMVAKSNANAAPPLTSTVNAYASQFNFMLAGIPQTSYFPSGMERKIHSLAVFNRALSAEEIADLS